jgi:5'(3')-deoxyribonucleotidase
MRLGIDLDGVVADFNQGWVDRYNRDFGASVKVEEIVEWDAPVGLTHFRAMSEFWEWARTCGEGKSVFRPLLPYPSAVEALTELERDGHEIVILTTKPQFAIQDTYEWLAEHRVPASEVHIVTDKTTVACDFYVDDADHNLASLVAARPAAMVCRYVRPWNHPHPGAIDVVDWQGIKDVLVTAASADCR